MKEVRPHLSSNRSASPDKLRRGAGKQDSELQAALRFEDEDEPAPEPESVVSNPTGPETGTVTTSGICPVPTEPPPTLWVGDAVQLRAFPGPSGTLRVVADQANAAGMTTEILLQPLLRATRSPVLSRYRTTKFFTFGPSLTCDVPTSARVVAVAMRFVALETGQSTPLMELGIVELPNSP